MFQGLKNRYNAVADLEKLRIIEKSLIENYPLIQDEKLKKETYEKILDAIFYQKLNIQEYIRSKRYH